MGDLGVFGVLHDEGLEGWCNNINVIKQWLKWSSGL